ncbi:DUF721 domain-containing protein [Thermus sp.]|uniref:DUF721 domain-containing protein n=1 Tax=Thermus sp. TaxID=275 RepID=UPI00307D8300
MLDGRGGGAVRRLKEMVPLALAQAGSRARMERALLLASWKEVVGPELARLTQALALEDGLLTVQVADPVLAHQLTYRRLDLLQRLSARFPGKVREIRFRVGPLEAPPPGERPPEEPLTPALLEKARALAETAPKELRERVERAALALLRKRRGSPCPICQAPSEKSPCPTCRRHLQSPLVAKEAERLARGKPPRLSGEPLLVARHLARERLLGELQDLYPVALKEPAFWPLLTDLAQRFRALFPEEPLPEGVQSLLKRIE